MIDITKINSEVLGGVRQRLGADDENDDTFDGKISNMKPKEIAALYSGWVLGNEDWAIKFIDLYEKLTDEHLYQEFLKETKEK